MQKVVGINFKHSGKVYYFDPGKFQPELGSHVVVETASGLELGEVAMAAADVEDSEIVQPLKSIVRMATSEDIERQQENAAREKEALELAEKCVAEHKLDMKLINAEYSFDGKKIIFFFTADGRIDFRDLVRDLAHHFHARIELRQIGVRDETKLLGGLGICGRPICCRDWMDDFFPVSIRMAKDQNISLNPAKISGLCGRLMCCLKFEHEHYAATQKIAPKLGEMVMTPGGPGQVTQNCFIREKSWVRIAQSDGSMDVKTYPMTEVRSISADEYNEAMQHLERYAPAQEESAASFGNLFDDVGFELKSEARRAKGEETEHEKSRHNRHQNSHKPRRGGEEKTERREKPENTDQQEKRSKPAEKSSGQRREHHRQGGKKPAEQSAASQTEKPAEKSSGQHHHRRRYSAGPRNRRGSGIIPADKQGKNGE